MKGRALHSKTEVREWLATVSDEALAQGMVPLFPAIENKLKQHNPQKRFAMDTDNDLAARLYAGKNRIIEQIINKGLAVDIMARLWEAPTEEQLEQWREEGILTQIRVVVGAEGEEALR